MKPLANFLSLHRSAIAAFPGIAICLCLFPPGAAGQSDDWNSFLKERSAAIRSAEGADAVAAEIENFAKHDHVEAARYLVGLLSHSRAPNLVKSTAAKVLGEFQDPEARAVVREVAMGSAGGNLYALRAVVKYDEAESRTWLLQLAADAKTPRAQSLAIDAIGALTEFEPLSEGFVDSLIEWMEEEDHFHGTRVAAARTLGRAPSPRTVEALIGQIHDPLLREAARESLVRISKEDHGGDRDAWQAWWESVSESYQPDPMKPAEFANWVEENRAKIPSEDASMEFYGMEVSGKNLLFLLDASGSMDQDDRMDRLKNELATMIEQLDERFQFGLIFFPKISVPGRDFDEADERYRERALEFIQSVYPNGDTPMWESLEYAFERVVPRHNVDTIYLLSDGVPSDREPEELADDLLGYHEMYGTPIHTIFLGDEEQGRTLMENVAKYSGGRFAHAP